MGAEIMIPLTICLSETRQLLTSANRGDIVIMDTSDPGKHSLDLMPTAELERRLELAESLMGQLGIKYS